jgi:hypothetical protein
MLKIRPSRRGNFDSTGARLIELGIAFVGYDHHQNCYAGVVIPPGLEAALEADPLIEVVVEAAPEEGRRRGPRWATLGTDIDLAKTGSRLRKLRVDAGLELEAAASRSQGKLSAKAIDRIERTGQCDVRDLVVLADIYAASLDHITGRVVVGGNRRR